MRKNASYTMAFVFSIITALLSLVPLFTNQVQGIEIGQQVEDDTWKVTCTSYKQIRQPQSVRVMPLGSGLQIVRQFTPSEGVTLFQVACIIQNAKSAEAEYSLNDIHTYSVPEDAFSVIGLSRGGSTDDPTFFLTSENPEIKDNKIKVSANENEQVVFLFFGKAKSKGLRFQFRDLSPYDIKW